MPKERARHADSWYEFGGLAGLGISLIIFVGMLGYTHGIVVESICKALRLMFGIGGFIVPIFGGLLSIALMTKKEKLRWSSAVSAFTLLFLAFLGFVHLSAQPGREFAGFEKATYGGIVGAATVVILRKAVGDVGGYIVLSLLSIGAVLVALRISPADMLTGLRNLLWHSWFSIQHSWKRRTARKAAITKLERRTKQRAQRKGKKVVREGGDGGNGAGAPKATGLRARLPAIEPVSELDESPFTPHIVTGQPRPKPRKEFKLVPEHYHKIIAALEPPSPSDIVNSDADSERGIKLVEDTLRSFKIEAKVVNVKRGPVVTRYEVQPAPGIRVSRIVNLADDLALALAAIDVRVEAPVPGKSVIGIEVPNKRIALVRLREILELEDFKRSPSKLVFALGKDIAGNPKLADLSLMPHILIGGATNSGKSVCLNSMIVSILSRADPDEVKISLIDPKRVELSLFAGVPHLMHPVVVDTKHAISALRGAVREMERRYELFAEKGVRNIETYNANLEDDEELLYHIVIVIDELADLMMQAPTEIEKLICRIAQMARATGIHLVIATQRPSVNVITGVIKANIPSRIAFAVASQVDSRTILDVNGAERLIGRGDMLYYPIDAPKPVRLQGAFVSEEEVNRVVQVLVQEYGEPEEYPLELQDVEDEMQATRDKLEKRDPLFDAAVELVRRRGYASASMLQREFEIGYPRAGKIIDQMERAGIVGPPEGSKPRKVLVPLVDEDIHDAISGGNAYTEEDETNDASSAHESSL